VSKANLSAKLSGIGLTLNFKRQDISKSGLAFPDLKQDEQIAQNM